MAGKSAKTLSASRDAASQKEGRVSQLVRIDSVAGIPGPGRWLVIEYRPTALFSLKISMATSSVGKTLVMPTPYAIKMAFVDAAFRAGVPIPSCDEFLRSLVGVDVRISHLGSAVVTHTFIKVRQESRADDPLRPYGPGIAYRELVYLHEAWRWAFDLAAGDDELAERLVGLAPYINYIGKRGCFVQYQGMSRMAELDNSFTQPLRDGAQFSLPPKAHIVPMDDFGPEATLQTLSSYSRDRVERGKHRKFVDTVIPLGVTNTGPGFTEYAAA